MNDCESLIKELRIYEKYGGSIPAKFFRECADAIERLQEERNYLVEQCKGCEFCKYAQKSFHEEPCSSCKWKSNFEWRGLK